MSIFVKGVEMPTEEQEPFRFELYADGAVVQLMPPDNDCEFKAIPVPDHRRLIDADAMEQDAQKRLLMCNKNDNQFQKPYEIMRAIALAPTIIEADKEAIKNSTT